METNHGAIQKRQHYYWLGRKYKDDNDLPKAIEAFLTYSSHLAPEDRHIPHQWISDLYLQLNDHPKALKHLEEFAKGCAPQRAAEIHKNLGDKYHELRDDRKALYHYVTALEKDLSIGVRKKIEELKKTMS